MIILRNKQFSGEGYEKQPYYSTKQRLGRAASGFGVGAGIGGLLGGISGGIIGGRTGAMVGAGIGGTLAGSAIGKVGWDITSKKYVDQENSRRKKQYEREEAYRKNPRLRYKSLEDPDLERGFRDIENKYGVKYKDDFYKYLKLRKKLVPILVDLEKRGTPVRNLSGILMEVNPRESSNWVETENDFDPDNLNSMISINPEMADDSWLVYNFKTGKYGYDDLTTLGGFSNIKSLLLDNLKNKEMFTKEEKDQEKVKGDLEFIKKYRDLINREL